MTTTPTDNLDAIRSMIADDTLTPAMRYSTLGGLVCRTDSALRRRDYGEMATILTRLLPLMRACRSDVDGAIEAAKDAAQSQACADAFKPLAQAAASLAKPVPSDPDICTDWTPKPMPNRSHDWTAWRDGFDELTGHGPTEAAAIADLLEQEEAAPECQPCGGTGDAMFAWHNPMWAGGKPCQFCNGSGKSQSRRERDEAPKQD